MIKNVLLILLNISIIGCIVLVALAPIIPAVIAGNVASSAGCQLDEGSIHPCVINGVDYGEQLYTWGMMPWFVFASFPVAAILFVIYLVIVGLLILVRIFRKPKKETPGPA
jgi:hypothetical protein